MAIIHDVKQIYKDWKQKGVPVEDPKTDHSAVTSSSVHEILPLLSDSTFAERPVPYERVLYTLGFLQHLRGTSLLKKKKVFASKKQFVKASSVNTLEENKVYYELTPTVDLYMCRRQHKIDVLVFVDGSKMKEEFVSQMQLWRKRTSLYTEDLFDALNISKVVAPAGFLDMYNSRTGNLHDVLHRQVGKYRTSPLSRITITVCGWSVGGLVAALVAPELVINWGSNINIVMFGSERLGNATLMQYLLYSNSRPKQYIRVYNPQDIASRWPPKSFGFWHVDEYATRNNKEQNYAVAVAYAPKPVVTQLIKKYNLLTQLYLWHTTYFLNGRVLMSAN